MGFGYFDDGHELPIPRIIPQQQPGCSMVRCTNIERMPVGQDVQEPLCIPPGQACDTFCFRVWLVIGYRLHPDLGGQFQSMSKPSQLSS